MIGLRECTDMNTREQRLMDTVDGLADDILDFTCRLVAEPSTLEHETSAMEVMEDELRTLSLDPVRVPVDPAKLSTHPGFCEVPWSYDGRYNVVATRGPAGSGGRSALFNGHLDVVSPEPMELWSTNPFDPVVRDGWLYGRGGGDMKAGVAAMTYACHAVDKAGFGLCGPVTLEAVIEEECGGNGALACRVEGYDADAVLIPEPFGPAIMTAQLGVLWFKFRVMGVPSHVLEAQAGVNAIETCFPLIAALRELEAEMNLEYHPAFEGLPHPINLNIGIIEGGDWPSTVPAAAEVHCRLSFFPGTTYQETCQRIHDRIAAAVAADAWLQKNPPEVTFYGCRSDGHVADLDQPAFHILRDCHRSLTGIDAETMVSTATTDVRSFHHFGRSWATCYGPVAENIHAADERVRIDSVLDTARVYALFLARWCGLAD
jgi:acetylornithine deacetylase